MAKHIAQKTPCFSLFRSVPLNCKARRQQAAALRKNVSFYMKIVAIHFIVAYLTTE